MTFNKMNEWQIDKYRITLIYVLMLQFFTLAIPINNIDIKCHNKETDHEKVIQALIR